MIKNEKIVRWLCKWFKQTDQEKVRFGDVVLVGGCMVCLAVVALLAIVAVVYIVGATICEIISDVSTHNETLQTYTSLDALLYGLGTIIGLIVIILVGDALYNIELAECPLQKGEDETEEPECLRMTDH